MIKDSPRLQAPMDETFEIAVDEAVDVLYEGLRNRLYAAKEFLRRATARSAKARF